MTAIENPSKHLNYLQQCLSSAKKPLGLFLGAGCPMAIPVPGDSSLPLIPDIAGISTSVRNELAKDNDCRPLLEKVEKHFKEDDHTNPTVEDMLTHIRALRAVAGKTEVRGFSAEMLDKLDERICALIHGVVDKRLPDPETPYHHIAY